MSPVNKDNGALLEFNDEKDIWDVIDKLTEETIELNKIKGNDFNIYKSVYTYLPFFSCLNHFLNKDLQKDIQKYIYCKDFGISPYNGDYGEQPSVWIEKYNIIKSTINNIEKEQIKGNKNGS